MSDNIRSLQRHSQHTLPWLDISGAFSCGRLLFREHYDHYFRELRAPKILQLDTDLLANGPDLYRNESDSYRCDACNDSMKDQEGRSEPRLVKFLPPSLEKLALNAPTDITDLRLLSANLVECVAKDLPNLKENQV